MKLVMQTAPTDRPITVEEAATHLREFDQHFYGEISRAIDAAVATLENQYWTQFCTATYDEYFDDWPADVFRLRRNPLGTVSSVKYMDTAGVEQTVAATVWEQGLEDGRGIVRLKHNQTWPSGCRGHADDIVIRYTCGYGLPTAVPAPVKQALLLAVADLYVFRETQVPMRLSQIPYYIDRLMSGYTFKTV